MQFHCNIDNVTAVRFARCLCSSKPCINRCRLRKQCHPPPFGVHLAWWCSGVSHDHSIILVSSAVLFPQHILGEDRVECVVSTRVRSTDVRRRGYSSLALLRVFLVQCYPSWMTVHAQYQDNSGVRPHLAIVVGGFGVGLMTTPCGGSSLDRWLSPVWREGWLP